MTSLCDDVTAGATTDERMLRAAATLGEACGCCCCCWVTGAELIAPATSAVWNGNHH